MLAWLKFWKKDKDERFDKLMHVLNTCCFTITLNMNDTFGYACADSEEMDADDMEELFPLYEKWGSCVFVAYASVKQDGIMPIKECQTPEFFKAKKEIERLAETGKVMFERYWEKTGRALVQERMKKHEG